MRPNQSIERLRDRRVPKRLKSKRGSKLTAQGSRSDDFRLLIGCMREPRELKPNQIRDYAPVLAASVTTELERREAVACLLRVLREAHRPAGALWAALRIVPFAALLWFNGRAFHGATSDLIFLGSAVGATVVTALEFRAGAHAWFGPVLTALADLRGVEALDAVCDQLHRRHRVARAWMALARLSKHVHQGGECRISAESEAAIAEQIGGPDDGSQLAILEILGGPASVAALKDRLAFVPAGARPVLKESIARIEERLERDRQAATLLRPAPAPPTDPDLLLRPASGPPEVDEQQLLRPGEGPEE